MNRTLRRPMFRIGGTAEGITSGLDHPQPTASRPRYSTGNIVLDRTKASFPEYQKALQSVRPKRGADWPDFLTSFGIDLLTRPKQGNIFQQLASSAKGPYDQWMERKTGREGVDDKLASALFGDVMDIETRKYEAEKKLEGDLADAAADAKSGKKSYEYKSKYDDYKALVEEQRRLEKELEVVQQVPTGVPPGPGGVVNQEKVKELEAKLEDNKKYQNLFVDKEEDEVRQAILKGISAGVFTFEDLKNYDDTGEYPKESEFAEGGRVGYQGGGMSLPSAAPASMQAAVPVAGAMDQGAEKDSSVQDLSFEELRARLPQEITNDIVKLLSESKQALVEFANIRTQQDVNTFNQKYDVNLVVPQEA